MVIKCIFQVGRQGKRQRFTLLINPKKLHFLLGLINKLGKKKKKKEIRHLLKPDRHSQGAPSAYSTQWWPQQCLHVYCLCCCASCPLLSFQAPSCTGWPQGLPREVVESHPMKIFLMPTCVTHCRVPALAGVLDSMLSWGAFQPSNSAILWACHSVIWVENWMWVQAGDS